MIGHGDGSSKRKGASRVQLQLSPEVQVLTHLGEEPNNNSCSCSSTSTGSSSNFGEADSEGDAEVDSPCEPVALAGARFMYSPLDGGSDSDSDSEHDLDNVELFCEEALALLAHEIVCCDDDCDSEIESEEEEDGEPESGSEMESGSDQVDGYGQDNLSASTYQLMFSEEEEEPGGNEKKDECPYVVESVLLLEEDQESEEKSDPKSGEGQGKAAPGCL